MECKGLGVSRRTARTYLQIFSRFGCTWGRKVHFSTFSGKLTFCPGSLQDTFIIYSSISHQHIFQTYFAKRKITRIKILKIWKSKNPGSLTGAQSNARSRISNGRSRVSHGLAAAPGHGQVALGAKKVARAPHSGPRSRSGHATRNMQHGPA